VESGADNGEDPASILKGMDVLVSGMALVSRTETLEDYLVSRVKRLGVIAIRSVFIPEAAARASEYVNGRERRRWPLHSVSVRNEKSFLGSLLLCIAFLNYTFQILKSAYRMRGRFDVFIGVSCYSAFMGVVLKALGKVRSLVYYSIDYYMPPAERSFNSLMVRAFRLMDRFCVRHADVTWHITGRIADARARMGRLSASDYRHVEAPLCFSKKALRSVPFEQAERWTVAFAGCIARNQGVQLVAEALPGLAQRVPNLRIRIIGRGPFMGELRALVKASGEEERVVFHGFVENENEMLDILSRCAVGIAPWTDDADSNILHADPGKAKLYLCVGLPCVLTSTPEIARVIEENGAGVAIRYDQDALVEAVAKVLQDDDALAEYRRSAAALGRQFTSEKVLGPALSRTLKILRSDPSNVHS